LWKLKYKLLDSDPLFQTFKEIEVAVRKAGSFSTVDFAVTLMMKAFHPKSGTLTDMSLHKSEPEAFAHLFAGD